MFTWLWLISTVPMQPTYTLATLSRFGKLVITREKPSTEVGPTALAWPVTFTLTYDLKSPASYGHDLLTGKSWRSMVSWFQRQSGNKQTGRGDFITSHANAVGKKELYIFSNRVIQYCLVDPKDLSWKTMPSLTDVHNDLSSKWTASRTDNWSAVRVEVSIYK